MCVCVCVYISQELRIHIVHGPVTARLLVIERRLAHFY